MSQLDQALFEVNAQERSHQFQDDDLVIDPLSFGIAPRQARFIDPQHLLILDVARRALDDAQLAPEHVRHTVTAVYVAMTEADHLATLDFDDIGPAHLPWIGAGNNRGMAAGRVSHFYDLLGPSLQVDTTCSSALVAMHMARGALAANEIDRALVIGSHLIRSPLARRLRTATGALSDTSVCNAFTDSANGFVIGEGVLGVVMERVESGDTRVRGEVLSTAINHDGRTAGLTVPSARAQESVIRSALERGGVSPAEVAYVEAHGTGTRLGDPIEVASIAAAYESASRQGSRLFVGSNKPQFGHLEAASGLLSVCVALRILARRVIPPTRSKGPPSELIDWANTNIELAGSPRSLAAIDRLCIGVSSFGMSGTNAHLILAEPTIAER